ncbi:A/G-specific adenine glycosylase [Aliiroseovarius crassostreae]|uniref:A/G-specific adenine glycosylase n=1 Tax=Aliiroseovarius crassostreae TaxID=154981 RepID=UPI0021AF908A|nr:A/G-specific adenine glycosylase [Aliiroseovarius crassostreae]UWP98351.1 A/G-specific adenine glycosylase [Aliiroseovarius crassostreae]
MCDVVEGEPKPADLLAWYDRHARVLPWRVGPQDRAAGVVPDPYAVWLSEIMLQQTTVAAVKSYFLRFMTLWPTVQDLAGAQDERVMGEWAGLGYYARARNLLKCARVVAERGGEFPQTRAELEALPGIGPYTSAAISAIAFDQPDVVVDGNVERVMARVFEITTPLPDAKPEMKAAAARLTPDRRPGDYAQAVMDLGATICTPKNPACGICPWRGACQARCSGLASDLPRKRKKPPKPTRYGIAYLARREDGAWLVERRPEKGLLGGMLGWPGAEWGEAPLEDPPLSGDWHDPGAQVRHTFTHFHLHLSLRVADVPMDAQPQRGEFQHLHPADLPTVMRKAYDLVQRDGAGRSRPSS